jgi:REP element-mobilizing transposase RayT
MPRSARIDAPGALQHVIFRGIEKRAIFRDNRDRKAFLDRLGEVLLETGTPCYAWVLMRNHVHLLLRTGRVPLATVMKRVLTGYAQDFNRRYGRRGHLFQNRYKSILCDEDGYLLELTRYIHLNPLRAKVVKDLRGLARYQFSGHGVLLKRSACEWQDRDYVLGFFGEREGKAVRAYESFVAERMRQGRRPDLVGGGLVRSAGGWRALLARRSAGIWERGDERILGRGEFVERVLEMAQEQLERKSLLLTRGPDLETLAGRVASRCGVSLGDLRSATKSRKICEARAVLCHLAVRAVGYPAATVAKILGLTPSAVSKAVPRGERIVGHDELQRLIARS